MSQTWAILVSGYGAFLFAGTEQEAEDMRCHKARWEQAVARKRQARPDEIKVNEVVYTADEAKFFHWPLLEMSR